MNRLKNEIEIFMMSVYVDGIHWKQYSYNYSFNNINLGWIFFISHFSFFSFLLLLLSLFILHVTTIATRTTTISAHTK